MELLTLEMLHLHLRIDFETKEEEKEMVKAANKAEKFVQNVTNKTFAEMKREYGDMPITIRHACLIMTDRYYMYPDKDEVQIPYTMGILLGPYVAWVKIESIRKAVGAKDISRDVLRMYYKSAVDITTTALNRKTSEIISEYGGIPRKLKRAVMIAIKSMCNNKKPIKNTSDIMANIPYKYDELIIPFVKL